MGSAVDLGAFEAVPEPSTALAVLPLLGTMLALRRRSS
jgi:hypothetical protein